jgi:hypothetical protein
MSHKKTAHNELKYKRELLGNYQHHECSVTDNKGHHCKDNIVHHINHNDKIIGLCEICYQTHLSRTHEHNIPTTRHKGT